MHVTVNLALADKRGVRGASKPCRGGKKYQVGGGEGGESKGERVRG